MLPRHKICLSVKIFITIFCLTYVSNSKFCSFSFMGILTKKTSFRDGMTLVLLEEDRWQLGYPSWSSSWNVNLRCDSGATYLCEGRWMDAERCVTAKDGEMTPKGIPRSPRENNSPPVIRREGESFPWIVSPLPLLPKGSRMHRTENSKLTSSIPPSLPFPYIASRIPLPHTLLLSEILMKIFSRKIRNSMSLWKVITSYVGVSYHRQYTSN